MYNYIFSTKVLNFYDNSASRQFCSRCSSRNVVCIIQIHMPCRVLVLHAPQYTNLVDRKLGPFRGNVDKNAKNLKNQLYPSLQSKKHFERRKTYSRSKDYFDHFSVSQVLVVRVFFTFNYIVFFPAALWKCLFFIRNSFLYANFPFHSLWSRGQLPSVTSIQNNWLCP